MPTIDVEPVDSDVGILPMAPVDGLEAASVVTALEASWRVLDTLRRGLLTLW